MFYIFHLLQSDMIFGIVNPFSWKTNAISSENSWLISMPFLLTHINVKILNFFPPAESWLVNSNFPHASRMQGSNWSKITFCILTNVHNSVSERFGPMFEQINISPTATAITVACILIYYRDKARKPVIGKVRCGLGFYCYTHPPTHRSENLFTLITLLIRHNLSTVYVSNTTYNDPLSRRF